MTTTDISPEAVERTINDLWERAKATEARQAELMIRALSAALTQSRAETAAAEAERDDAQTDLAKVIMSLPTGRGMRSAGAVEGVRMLRADCDAAETRGMRNAAEICPDVEPCDYDEYDLVGRFNQGFDAGIDYCRSRILAAIPQGEK